MKKEALKKHGSWYIGKRANRRAVCLAHGSGSEENGTAQGCSILIASSVWAKMLKRYLSGKVPLDQWVLFEGERFGKKEQWAIFVTKQVVCLAGSAMQDKNKTYPCSLSIKRATFDGLVRG
jgi:hypothetical protein